jgi:hypothetical protein
MPPAAMPSLSRRAFALHVGVDEAVIRKLIKRGELPVNANNQIPMPQGLVAYAAVRSLEPATAAETARATPSPNGEAPAAPQAPAMHRTPAQAQASHAADLARREWTAKLAEQKYKERAGELLPLAEVQADANRTCSAVQAGLNALSARLELVLVAAVAGKEGSALAAAIRGTIDAEVAKLQRLLRSRLAAPKGTP